MSHAEYVVNCLNADSIEVRANRIDSRIIDKEQKRVLAITEMSCPWLDNCEVRDMEKTQK